MNMVLRIVLIILFILAGIELCYYSLIYLPEKQQQKERQERIDNQNRAQAERDKKLMDMYNTAIKNQKEFLQHQDERIEADKKEKALQDQEQKLSDDLERMDQADRYSKCISMSYQYYTQAWSDACSRIAREKDFDLQACLNDTSITENPYLGRGYCIRQTGYIDRSSNCLLPKTLANSLESEFNSAKTQCQHENPLGY